MNFAYHLIGIHKPYTGFCHDPPTALVEARPGLNRHAVRSADLDRNELVDSRDDDEPDGAARATDGFSSAAPTEPPDLGSRVVGPPTPIGYRAPLRLRAS